MNYTATACDNNSNGGTSPDTFAIQITGAANSSQSGPLSSGNITLGYVLSETLVSRIKSGAPDFTLLGPEHFHARSLKRSSQRGSADCGFQKAEDCAFVCWL